MPCDLFRMAMRLVEGSYYAEASLLGEGGIVVTLVQRYESSTVLPDREVTVSIDFPLDAAPGGTTGEAESGTTEGETSP